MTDRAVVSRWLARYEAAWRAPGTEVLPGLFTGDAIYLQSPYEQPVTGLDAIKRMWEDEREGPDEVFTLATRILAVDGETAVVRAEVRYGNPPSQEYRDLWVIRFASNGRCTWFEEWPYWPGRPRVAGGDSPPDLHMVNLVVADMAASLDFYRRLGVAVPQGQDAVGAHVQLRMPGGFSFELDTAESARLWHAGWRADPAGVRVVIGFSLPAREAVDQRYAELTSAGHEGRQPPFDAFWGARYAIVADPDGNDVGLMSPIDESRRTGPPAPSPDP